MPIIYASAMKDRESPPMNYQNCSGDSGEVQCVAMTGLGWDCQSVRRLPQHTSGSSPRGAPDVERSSYSPFARTRRGMLLKARRSLRQEMWRSIGSVAFQRTMFCAVTALPATFSSNFFAVVAQIEPGARRRIGFVAHRTFPEHAVVVGGVVQVFLGEGESLRLLRPPVGIVEWAWN